MVARWVEKRAIVSVVLATLMMGMVVGCSSGDSTSETTKVTGTVAYRERIALLPGATLTVSVIDGSRQDAAANEIGVETIALDDQQVPIPFSVNIDADAIDSSVTYSIRATINNADGALAWTTDTVYPVEFTGDDVDAGELLLVRVGGS